MPLSLTSRERKMLTAVTLLLLLGLLGMVVLRDPPRRGAEAGFSGRDSAPPAQSAP